MTRREAGTGPSSFSLVPAPRSSRATSIQPARHSEADDGDGQRSDEAQHRGDMGADLEDARLREQDQRTGMAAAAVDNKRCQSGGSERRRAPRACARQRHS